MQDQRKTLIIRTPEGTAFPLILAGPVTRALAFLVDGACIMALASLIETALAVLGVVSPDLARAVGIFSYFVVSIGYGILLEWFLRGQTLGKRLLSLRVMDASGLYLTFPQIVVRNLLRFVDLLPAFYMVGGLSCLVSAKSQRLGDIAAGTVVVASPKVFEPDLDQIIPDKYNSFRTWPHLAARLRQRIGPREAGVALAALLTRDGLDPEARVALFGRLADFFRDVVTFPQEATDGLSDERYVRNVVDILYRS